MTYSLGVDLGTTYTAAAIRRHDRTDQRESDRLEIVDLGTRIAAIPSVVYLRDDGAVLTGEAAVRRGATDPGRLAREFKRRMGDTTAILLGGVPYSVDALMASMLRSVVATVAERQGEPPAAIAIAHPANWGRYKLDLLDQAVRRADLDDVALVTEPQAAAVHYATLERLEPGATVAVYDLGGGTFDAAVLRKTPDGFELLGVPEGIERLGGIDFDEAVFRHVTAALGGAVDELDPDDPVAQAAVSRLREECVAAKEALSADTEVSVPVLLPNRQTEVRLTRAELESMIRPALGDTLVVLRRTLRSAAVTPDDLHSVLLVGGSSRIPLIAQMVGADLGRPVALDVHPKHSVAMGAAVLAGAGRQDAAAPLTAPLTAPLASPVPAPVLTPPTPAPPASADPAPAAGAATAPTSASPWVTTPVTPDPEGAPPPGPGSPVRRGGRERSSLLVGAGLGAAALAVIGAVLVLRPGGDGDAAGLGDGTTTVASAGPTASTGAPDPVTAPTAAPGTAPPVVATTAPPATAPLPTAPVSTAPVSTAVATTLAPVDPCADAGTEPCVVIDQLRVTETGAIEVTWSPRNFVPDVENGFHAHLYWNTGSAAQASTDAASPVPWDAVDQTVHTSAEVLVMSNRPPDATGVCATVGIAPSHTAYDPARFHCVPLPPGSI